MAEIAVFFTELLVVAICVGEVFLGIKLLESNDEGTMFYGAFWLEQ